MGLILLDSYFQYFVINSLSLMGTGSLCGQERWLSSSASYSILLSTWRVGHSLFDDLWKSVYFHPGCYLCLEFLFFCYYPLNPLTLWLPQVTGDPRSLGQSCDTTIASFVLKCFPLSWWSVNLLICVKNISSYFIIFVPRDL